MDSPAWQEWVQRARDVPLLDAAQIVGARLKRAGGDEHVGPCPACNGTDRFSINAKMNVWNCRGALGGNDSISLVQHAIDGTFVEAVSTLTGEAPPRGTNAIPSDPEALRECKQDRVVEAVAQANAAKAKADRTAQEIAALWSRARPIAGTKAAAYLKARGLAVTDARSVDLRFVADLDYFGVPAPSGDDREGAGPQDPVRLGAFPCMIAAIRDVSRALIGLHRTYLAPEGLGKLRIGDTRRNAAKKVFGRQVGGLIRLGEPGETLAIGEGIETTLSWHALGCGPDDVTIASGVNLGNMAGHWTGTVPHPLKPGRMICNGVPDVGQPGLVLPPQVKTVILIGDGDSDPHETRAKLLCGARRFRAQGLEVLVHVAPDGTDFNNLLVEAGRAA